MGIGGRSGDVGDVAVYWFLHFLVALGIGGLLLFVSLLVWLLVRLHRSAAVSRAGQTALASGFVVIISQMMTLDLQNLRYVWVYFGLVLGVSMLDRSVGKAMLGQRLALTCRGRRDTTPVPHGLVQMSDRPTNRMPSGALTL